MSSVDCPLSKPRNFTAVLLKQKKTWRYSKSGQNRRGSRVFSMLNFCEEKKLYLTGITFSVGRLNAI